MASVSESLKSPDPNSDQGDKERGFYLTLRHMIIA